MRITPDITEISKIYCNKKFKIQIIIRCLFHIVIILFFPISNLLSKNYILSNLIFTTILLIGSITLILLEKKELFIPREYFHKNNLRIIAIIIFYWVLINTTYLNLCKVIVFSTIVTLIEVYSCYKEYVTFCSHMKEFKNSI